MGKRKYHHYYLTKLLFKLYSLFLTDSSDDFNRQISMGNEIGKIFHSDGICAYSHTYHSQKYTKFSVHVNNITISENELRFLIFLTLKYNIYLLSSY